MQPPSVRLVHYVTPVSLTQVLTMATNVPVTLDTLIVIKVQFQGHSKKFKIPLRDLGANVLPEKVRDAPAASSLTRRPGCHTAAWPADPCERANSPSTALD